MKKQARKQKWSRLIFANKHVLYKIQPSPFDGKAGNKAEVEHIKEVQVYSQVLE